MRLHRPILAGIALSAVLPVTAASAAAGVTSAGSALSSATLVSISVGSLLDVVEKTSLSLGTLSATAQNVTDAAPAVTFTPVTLNGVKTGAVTVTPANSPKTVGGVATGSLAGLISATSPGATLTASNGAKPTSALTASLGEASILGLEIELDGGVEAGSTTDTAQAMAAKGLSISNVSLPNIADLLAALGIDMAKLPVGTLNALIEDLRIAVSAATQTALDAANTAYDTAAQNLADGNGAVTQATNDLAGSTASLEAALSGADLGAVPLPAGVTAPLSAAEWDMLDAGTQDAVEALNSGLATVAATYAQDKLDLAAAEGAIQGLQDAVDAALAALAGVVEGVLAGVPLVEVGAADIGTKALVGKTKEASVTGFVSGVKVLGTDILADVTGDTEVDAAALVGDLADEVNAALNTATTALSNALSSVTGATGLVFPAPVVEVMKKTTKTGTDGAYGTAKTTLTALSISLGSLTVPDAFALAGAGDLAGLGAITGGFKTAPLSVEVGAIVESARFRTGTNTPTPGHTGALPTTGGPTGLAIIAVIGTALAVGIRRLRNTTA